jgi:excisionase family DNA binding protein
MMPVHAARSSVAHVAPVAVLDGRSCVVLERFLAPMVRALEAAGRLAPIRDAVDAIVECAAAQREHDRQAFTTGVTAEWLTVTEAAERAGCSPQNVRARLQRGTLAGERVGRTWRVAPQLPQPSA